MCDTGVQSAWPENRASGGRGLACQRRNCSSHLPLMLPFQVHARVTDDVARRPFLIVTRPKYLT